MFFFKNESQTPPHLLPHTNTCLSTVRFSENDILKVIQKLDPIKAHVHNKISIRMLKLSVTSCLETSFPTPLEKSQRCDHTKEKK